MQVEQKDREIEESGQVMVEESNAYSLFMYAVRSPVTIDYYLRRLRIFLNHIIYFQNERRKKDAICLRQQGQEIRPGPLVLS